MDELTDEQLDALVAPDGTHFGDAIPGSRWYRSFCRRCGAPMRGYWRVTSWCQDCGGGHGPPAPYTGLTGRQVTGKAKTGLQAYEES